MNRTVGIVIVLLVVLGLAIYINAQRQTGPDWQDGTYVGRSEPDERGWFGEIEIRIADGKIAEVNYEEINQDGNMKDENYPYPAGPNSHDDYEAKLVDTQDPEKVDAISGATQTRDRFVQAAQEALRKAEQGDQSRPAPIQPAVPPVGMERPGETMDEARWQDGTYTARTEPDDHGYYGEIEITITDNKITEVNYDEKDQEGNPKGENYPYPLGPESEDRYEEQLLEKQNPEQVEVVTGATQTWERFKEAARKALQEASQVTEQDPLAEPRETPMEEDLTEPGGRAG